MDVGASNSSIPTTDDQELANLLGELNSEKHEVSSPSEESEAAGSSTTPSTTDDTSTPTADDTTIAGVDTHVSESKSNSEDILADQPESAVPAETDVASLDASTANISTPSPMDVMDELNAPGVTPATTGSTVEPASSTTVESADEPATASTAKPLEPLELDAATIAAASNEADQKVSTATGANTNVTPTAAEEVNIIRDKILNYLSEMIRDINQAPKEKFETIVSILRGTNDKSLLKDALETAIQIKDPNDKAKAMVELVNIIDELAIKK
jgi:hypothetical protein